MHRPDHSTFPWVQLEGARVRMTYHVAMFSKRYPAHEVALTFLCVQASACLAAPVLPLRVHHHLRHQGLLQAQVQRVEP